MLRLNTFNFKWIEREETFAKKENDMFSNEALSEFIEFVLKFFSISVRSRLISVKKN